MTPSPRIPSPLTLSLVRAMATNPESPQALRDFHAASLADMERRVRNAAPARRSSPFSRFAESLETEPLEN